MNEKLIMNALRWGLSFNFTQNSTDIPKETFRNLADNEVKTEPCIDAQSSCLGVDELKRPPVVSSLKLDHYWFFDTSNIRNL